MRAPLPSLVGVIHLRPLPESPRYDGDLAGVVASAERDARALAAAGFDGVVVENFGDAPFVPGRIGGPNAFPKASGILPRCAS